MHFTAKTPSAQKPQNLVMESFVMEGFGLIHSKFAAVNSQTCERAAEMYYLNSCRSRFSGVYLVFEVFQDTWRSNKEILVHTGMLPCLVP